MEIRTQEKFGTALRMRENMGAFWLGGNDKKVEGNWVWNSNEKKVKINGFWQKERPRHDTEKNCLAMGRIGMWDGGCTNPRKSVCEFN